MIIVAAHKVTKQIMIITGTVVVWLIMVGFVTGVLGIV